MSCYSLYSPLSCSTRQLKRVFKNRRAAHSKTPHMLSGFPINPVDRPGSAQVASRPVRGTGPLSSGQEVGAVVKSQWQKVLK